MGFREAGPARLAGRAWFHFWVVAILAVGFTGVAGHIMYTHADASHYVKDGAAYRFQARMLASGMIYAPEPPVETAFPMPMTVVHDGRWFAQYYPGFPLVLAAGALAGLDWLVNPLFGGLLILGTYLLARQLYGTEIGLMAALFIAASPLLLTLATTYQSHVVCAVLLLSSVMCLLKGTNGNVWRWGVLSGFLFGWGVAARPYTGILLAPTVAAILGSNLGRSPSRILRLGAAFAVAALPWGIGLLAWNHVLTGDALLSPYKLAWPMSALGFHEIARRRGFIPGQELTYYSPSVAWIATKGQLARLNAMFLPVWFPVALLPLTPLVLARTIGPRGLLMVVFPVSLVVGHFFYQGISGSSGGAIGPRYYSEALPMLTILMALPLTVIARSSVRARRVVWCAVLATVILAGTHGARGVSRTVEGLHAGPLRGANRTLERHLAGLDDERRLIFVDISTYNRTSAILVNRPDLKGQNVVAVYREPNVNAEVSLAFPDRAVYLMRWDINAGQVVLAPYDPATDTEGPPDRFPYRRHRKRGSKKDPVSERRLTGEAL